MPDAFEQLLTAAQENAERPRQPLHSEHAKFLETRQTIERAAVRTLQETHRELLSACNDFAPDAEAEEENRRLVENYTAAVLDAVREIQGPMWGPGYVDPSGRRRG